ncbi:Tex family protein [Bacillus solimangrovi]|uniref:RNA-binding transcriptional accessory protein n=1 Tax=Bacillus solimangrovi TaxID=1305675 RepID=A0A1E5LGA7_9BACI|nr:Tex family protein [Bacillus solimangrovi]OEH93104.1 RNA-binding transcriptional accessory protein [Bacillus solimangrovi]
MIQLIANEMNIKVKQVNEVISLLEDSNTVPFIARYRKEQTGALDEVAIRDIQEKWQYIQNLEKRKEEVIRLIAEQEKLTDDLEQQIQKVTKLQQVEDLYRPYKQKRRTKATVAKEKGLEPLAKWLFEQPLDGDVKLEAQQYLSEEHEINTVDEALIGAQDIIAEWVADDATIRQTLREKTFKQSTLTTKVKDEDKDDKKIYEMYYDYSEPVAKIVPHRVLAVNRGEKEGVLKVNIASNEEVFVALIERHFIRNEQSPAIPYIKSAISDSYKRLIDPSIEREIRNELTEKAEEQAIHIFAENLRNLLLQPPLKGKIVLGVDPAYRTGCKLSVIDPTGKVLHIDVIYPHPPVAKKEEARKIIKNILQKYNVEMVAIGNGTASRETESFVADILKELESEIYYLIVNEAGASVYSASDLARLEFPDLQVEERSAISIARRLQDPLAELVKIDPKSVGVGQYQHDVSQKYLSESLTFVVETVVNQVGVNVNTASSSLLQYVSGLSKTAANNIVKMREENGRFESRSQLKKVPRLGPKTYEQSIGFLRVLDGKHPLDRTPIHPESYKEASELLESLGFTVDDVGTKQLQTELKKVNISQQALELEIGELTLQDIIDALSRPERDPRDDVAKPLLRKDILTLEDLSEGMELEGTVRNVVDFGAFVDIGVKQDGLVHISKLSNKYVKHPMDIVSVGEIVNVWIENVDKEKGRIALTMLPS